MHIYFDGGCNPNPGMMEICFVVKGEVDEVFDTRRIGNGTNNIAEWAALLDSLLYCEKRGYKNVTIYGDSNLVVKQANDEWKVKQDHFRMFKVEVDRLKKIVNPTIKWVPRDNNLAGIYLEHGHI